MVTNKVIDAVYKQYKKRPASIDELDTALLFTEELLNHDLYVDEGRLVINSIDPHSPFHSIALDRIHAIVNFENVVAIVLHSSIIFLSKRDNKVHVHIKMEKPSFMDRVRMKFANAD